MRTLYRYERLLLLIIKNGFLAVTSNLYRYDGRSFVIIEVGG